MFTVRLMLFLALVLLLLTAPLAAQDAESDAVADTSSAKAVGSSLTTALLESKIKEVGSALEMDEAAKAKLTELYRKALSSLEQAKADDAKAATYAEALEAAPEQLAELRKEIERLDKAVDEPPAPIPPALAIRELEQRLAKEQADVTAIEAKLGEMEKELDDWSRRPTEARQRITEAKADLEELELELDQPAPEGETEAMAEAHRWVRESRQRELRAEILKLDQELLSLAARTDVLQANRDKSTLDLRLLQTRARALEEQLNERRRAEAEQAKAEADAATRDAAGKHPLVQRLVQENSALTEELTSATAALDKLDDELANVETRTKQLAEEFRTTRQRVEIAGLSEALGQVLIDRRTQLPDTRVYRRAAKAREAAIADANLRQIRHDEEQRALRDPDAYLERLLVDELPPAERTDELRAELRPPLKRRQELLRQARETEDVYLRALGDLDYASGQLMQTLQSYEDFLAERLLWVRSTAAVGPSTIAYLPQALAWFLSPANWLEVGEVLVYEAQSSPLLWLLVLVAIVLLWKGRSIRAALLATAEPLRRVRTDSFRYTLEGLLLTVLLAAPLPLLSAALGWQLSASVEATPFTKAVGAGLTAVSTGLFSLRAFSLLCITGGVADRHFRWSGRVLRVVRRNFAWAIVLLVPAGFAAAMVHQVQDLTYSASLGRLTLIVLMVGLAIFTARLVRPTKGMLQNIIAERPESWVARLRKVWYALVIAIPLALVVLTLIGYMYTAGILLRSFVSSLWLVLVLTVVQQSVERWLILTRRRLALQAALERRAARAAEEARTEPRPAGVPAHVEEPELDLASLDEQTRRLLNALMFFAAAIGLWVIWSDVLPAFGVLDEVALWHYTGVVDGKEEVIPVTLASILLVLFIAALGTVGARNLPALLEILLLRTSMTAGGRYAVRTLTAYFIAAVAALTVFSTLGLSWGSVQWLVAALGVGIGFGLQEIVANFISGIIILFERPVRVGDVVTIGDTTGTVSRIQIRAITIRNWDKQELLVPNKEFITGRLLNWTLTDTLNRVTIPVGIDYEADVTRALELLREAATENERALDDPAPLITFEGFGDNALNLVLRFYLESLDYRLAVITEMHRSINDKFRAAGISIAFPQRDVHLTTPKPLDLRIQQAWPEANEPPAPPADRGDATT